MSACVSALTCLVMWLMTVPLDSELMMETKQSLGSPVSVFQTNN